MWKLILSSVIFLLVSESAFAQTPRFTDPNQKQTIAPPAAAVPTTAKKPLRLLKDIPPGKIELIKRMIDANGARQTITTTFNQLIAKAPVEKQASLKENLSVDGFIAELTPIYDSYYSEDDLKELIRFYLSPTGQKVLGIASNITDDTIQAMVKYFQKVAGPDVQPAKPSA